MSLFSLDGDGGITKLIGPANYNRWARDFRLLAESLSLWSFFTMSYASHNITITRLDMNGRSHTVSRADSVTQAVQLLKTSVDSAFRAELEQFDEDPKAAWEFLRGKYRMADSFARGVAARKMEGLYLPDFKSMAHYLNEFKLLQQDIIDAGGHVEEFELVEVIIEGLSPEYDSGMTNGDLASNPIDLSIEVLTRKLLYLEAVKQREYRQQRKQKACDGGLIGARTTLD